MIEKENQLDQLCKIVNLVRQKEELGWIGMLSVNGRVSRDASRADTTWLEDPELNVGDAFNQQISGRRGSADWSHVQLSEEGSRENNELKGKGKSAFFWSKDRSSSLERRYQLVVRLKAIEYKEDFLCYLSSTSSLQGSPSP